MPKIDGLLRLKELIIVQAICFFVRLILKAKWSSGRVDERGFTVGVDRDPKFT